MMINRTVPPLHLHIGDRMVAEGAGGVHQHVFPATGEVQGLVPLAGRSDVDAAVVAAQKAFAGWRAWKPADRARVLGRLAELIQRDADELARLAVLDNGMTLSTGKVSAGAMAQYTGYYARWADKIEGRVTSVPAQSRELAYTIPDPYGVVAIIMTWNSPMFSVGMKLAPALAAGNTVVLKPSELTPYTSERLMTLVRESGIPDGVVNLLLGGAEAGDALVRHPLVQKVSFTGGPATARKILAACAESIKPAVLELGGKSANLIFPDADLDTAAMITTYTVNGVLAGQGCAIASRMLVHEDVYDEVAEKVVEQVRAMRYGDPFDPATTITPVITKAAQTRILGMIDRARAEGGGTLLIGGGVPSELTGTELEGGFFVEPTVFGDVVPASELGQVEVFGPVLSLIRFSTEDEAVEIANATEYGLASYAYTKDIDRIARLTTRLQAGGVYINGAQPVLGCELPFGGIGISGFGREGGLEGLLEFVRTKAVAIA
ncbi:aldehyde dehydrogenase [Frankia sp. AgB1.9]|uniref:aldehyde dehydrogenase family protein n=1 Tax=unclassified Frankia TaxID=2632575 RepID=UPI001932C5E3|nr:MULTISPECIES: aldehyde dehydrogenase family protein [unclassified Frankia]MBL7489446.1 aldehyde dehydrogenase [Frankia sp. AgW1.1]MBL7550619.1 aldehyde dehydrogenase [Frankia sp. AgB1.9]MBL7621006.1 aldehyde dehydrogenase [Frankia sp. AgB1.8]